MEKIKTITAYGFTRVNPSVDKNIKKQRERKERAREGKQRQKKKIGEKKRIGRDKKNFFNWREKEKERERGKRGMRV